MPRLKRLELGRFGRHAHEAWLAAGKPDPIAIDTETEGAAFYDRPFCVTISWAGYNAYFELGEGNNDAYVREILQLSDTWIFHNAKFDLQKLILAELTTRAHLDARTIHDTEAIWHLLNNVDRKGLKYLAKTVLGCETNEDAKLAKVRRKLKIKKDDGYFYLPRQYVIPYACKDTEYTLGLFDTGWAALSKFPTLVELYEREMELTLVLLDMEANGMRLDMDYLKRTASDTGRKVMEKLTEIQALGVENPASPKQLLVAFHARGFTKLDSTDADHLKPMDDDLARAVLEYRSLTRMHKTYLMGLLEEQRDGLVHPNFRQHGAKTGRMSSGKADSE